LTTQESSNITQQENDPLFIVEMNWGQQPVRLTAWRCDSLPPDAPTTSVHVVAFYGRHLLVVRDRKGLYGFPGGRLDRGESREQAMAREVYEEANAYIEPNYTLYAVLKIEYTARLPGRNYPYDYSYMGMYVGKVRRLDPFNGDPAGIILERALFTAADCNKHLLAHDKILLREAITAYQKRQADDPDVQAFLSDTDRDSANGLHAKG
jgi:8-oxo-dGTP pyrophosphatase MutT (NUDIX family)